MTPAIYKPKMQLNGLPRSFDPENIQAQTHQNSQPSANMLFVQQHVSCVVYNYIAKPCLYRNHELVFLNHILQHKQHGMYDT